MRSRSPRASSRARLRLERMLAEGRLVARQGEERRPLLGDDALGPGDYGRLHDGVVVDVEEPRGVLHALDVATDPVEVLGDAAQHQAGPDSERTQVSLEPPPCEELTTR